MSSRRRGSSHGEIVPSPCEITKRDDGSTWRLVVADEDEETSAARTSFRPTVWSATCPRDMHSRLAVRLSSAVFLARVVRHTERGSSSRSRATDTRLSLMTTCQCGERERRRRERESERERRGGERERDRRGRRRQKREIEKTTLRPSNI